MTKHITFQEFWRQSMKMSYCYEDIVIFFSTAVRDNIWTAEKVPKN